MPKILYFKEKARDRVMYAINLIAKAVLPTLGPSGRTAMISKESGYVEFVDDGFHVLNSLQLKNELVQAVVKTFQLMITRINDEAGDGTATGITFSTDLYRSVYNILNEKSFFGKYPNKNKLAKILSGMQKAQWYLEKRLDSWADKIETKEDFKKVALISSLDEEIAEIIADITDKLGKNGIITMAEGNQVGYQVEIVKGIRFEKPFIAPFMITDKQNLKAEIENIPVLILDRNLTDPMMLKPLCESMLSKGMNKLFIIAEDFTSPVLDLFFAARYPVQGSSPFYFLAVKSPFYGETKRNMLEDIATLTGATVISNTGITLDKATVVELGMAEKVSITTKHTTIINANANQEKIANVIDSLKAQIEQLPAGFEREKLNERIARLSSGIGIIKVGAWSEAELRAKKFKIEDALHAVKAAGEQGIVAGGGAPFVQLSRLMLEDMENLVEHPDEMLGVEAVAEALMSPFWQLCENAGMDDDETRALARQIEDAAAGTTYDFKNMKIAYMSDGIVDPVKVLKTVISVSVSGISTLLSSDTLMIEEEKEKDENRTSW